MDKSTILFEIKRTAEANGGAPLGWRKFSSETGIRSSDWCGKIWARWSEALAEAGFAPNKMTEAYEEEYLLHLYAIYSRELRKLPTASDLRLKARTDNSFPSETVFANLGTKMQMIRLLAKFCGSKEEFSDVAEMCESYIKLKHQPLNSVKDPVSVAVGYVYLFKHGTRHEYKIGRTTNTLRREGELRIELPERLDPIHTIQTDDPSGVEAYWHRRFSEKRLQGEWFALSADEVRAFKRWKRIY